jgi:hypothetical protein
MVCLSVIPFAAAFALNKAPPFYPGTVVATLLTPIGSEFNANDQASYIGTSYLLSVCCFTPLYGSHFFFDVSRLMATLNTIQTSREIGGHSRS